MSFSNFFVPFGVMANKENLFLDALTCTLRSVPQTDEHETAFIHDLANILGATIVESSKGQSSYPNMIMLQGERERGKFNVRCRYGATRQNMNLSLASTGFISIEVKEALKQLGVWYIITRADVAIDWVGDFDHWHSICKAFRVKRGLKSGTVGDWEDGADGRTYNMGSRTSESMARLYEKTLELRQKGYVNVPDNLLRLELEYKPIKQKRELLQDFDLVQLLSQSKVGTDLFNHVFELGLTPSKHDYTIQDDIWIALSHVAVQYRRHFKQAIAENGWDEIHNTFAEIWKMQDIGAM